jgi:hypothetical protein
MSALDAAVTTFLSYVDFEVPGLVEGFYLVGSAALDDFRLRVSDIDFVAVTADRVGPAEVAALQRAHERFPARSFLDGTYLTWADLAQDPTRIPPVPGSLHGRFSPTGGVREPVAWHTLARYGQTYRGPKPSDVDIWADTDALATWTDSNLSQYWAPLLDRWSRLVSPPGAYALSPAAAVWTVTGVTRLHYTLSTGDITSKTGAARYGLSVFTSRWHPVLEESLRIRTGVGGRSEYRTPWHRRRDVLEYGRMVVADAHRLYGAR